MRMSSSGHKATTSLLRHLESSHGGGKRSPVAVAYRHRLAFTLLALFRTGGGGGGSGTISQKTANDLGDLIDMLTDQQNAAGAKPDNDRSGGGQPVSNPDCSSLYARYKAAVAAKQYTTATGLLRTYQDCLKGFDQTPKKGRLPERADP